MSVARTWLTEIRTNRRERWYALVGAAALGLVAAWVHWYGFVLGGALVGLVSKNVKRGLLAGIGFGVLAWVGFVALLASYGSLTGYLGMGQVTALSAAIPIVGGLLGSLVRGAV
jgi:hypothetical protein